MRHPVSQLYVFLIFTAIVIACREREPKKIAVDTVSGLGPHSSPPPDSMIATLQVRAIAGLTYEFDSIHGRLPASFEELANSSAKYTGPDTAPPDAWGHSIEFLVSGDSFAVRSLGKDGMAGTHDDIVYQGFQGEGMAAMRKK